MSFRVYHLARDLEIEAATVSQIARDLGIEVNSILSQLTPDEAAAIQFEWHRHIESEHPLAIQLRAERSAIDELEQLVDGVSTETSASIPALEKSRRVESATDHGPFIGSNYRKHFHRFSCKYVTGLFRSPRARYFSTHEEAVAAGYRPCKTCRS
jgi:hypothetical protein